MLKDYPIKFNDETVPDPIKFDAEQSTIEQVNETEAGTDLIVVTRYGKMSYNCEFHCSSMWAHKFAMYARADVIELSCYDLLADGLATKSVRLRDFRPSLVDNSRNVEGTNGLYRVTFKLEEF